jgi:predicted nucleic acid-binding protein
VARIKQRDQGQGAEFAESAFSTLILSGAMQANCGLLYSEDMQHGQKIGSLRIVNPFL